jgi:hypothetical protein
MHPVDFSAGPWTEILSTASLLVAQAVIYAGSSLEVHNSIYKMPVYKRPTTRSAPSECEYDRLRRSFINDNIREAFPKEIHLVSSVEEVSRAIQRAVALGSTIGVRSGGHLFSNVSLIHEGILIDTSNLNRKVEYDLDTNEVAFGPAVRVSEASEALEKLGRFFPHGHAPSVALGGFTLAGGQGMFMPGWGPTVEQWITKLEIVTADGQIRVASKTENSDLFWAARGSGQAFFGVLTKIWGRTIPARKMYARSILMDVKDDNFEDLLEWALSTNSVIPKWGTESAIAFHYPEMMSPEHKSDDIPRSGSLHMGVFSTAYVNTLSEAQALLQAWNRLPDHLQTYTIDQSPVAEMSWEQFFDIQELMTPSTPGGNWQINSILNNPSMALKDLVKAIKPAMCDLPTRTSLGCIFCADSYPDDKDHLCSVAWTYAQTNDAYILEALSACVWNVHC